MLQPLSIPELVHEWSKERGVDPQIVAAMIRQESNGEIFARRPELGFRQKYLEGKQPQSLPGVWPKGVTFEEEMQGRSSSWGLMQIMGNTARMIGFKGKWFGSLFLPEVNISLGTLYLKQCLDRARSSYPHADGKELYRRALSCYNAGRPDSEAGLQYASKIFDHIQKKSHHEFYLIPSAIG